MRLTQDTQGKQLNCLRNKDEIIVIVKNDVINIYLSPYYYLYALPKKTTLTKIDDKIITISKYTD